MNLQIVAFIFARGGSKGVPGKNIRSLAGKPLIAYAIDVALRSPLIERVVVSTNDDQIAEVAEKYGAEVPFLRPKELAEDNSSEWLAWQHAIRTYKEQEKSSILDVFVSIPPTSPLRIVEDVDNAINAFLEGESDIIISVKNTTRHPSFNMVVLDKNHYAELVLPLKQKFSCRQNAPLIYDMATVAYVANPDFIMDAHSIFEGKVKTVLVPEERALDIDTELDFQIADFLMRRAHKVKT